MSNLKKYINPSAENVFLCYILYLLGLIWPVFQGVGFLCAIMYRSDKNKFLRSHYMWLYRTAMVGWVAYFAMLSQMFGVLGVLLVVMVGIWYVTRVAYGMRYLLNKEAHVNPLTFWIN